MNILFEQLIPYSFPNEQLGDRPWSSLSSFIAASKISGYKTRLARGLHKINNMALERSTDTSCTEAPYERPFLFMVDTGEPYEGKFPPSLESDHVTIDMDGLHAFIASGILDREVEVDEAIATPPYWKEVGPGTLNVAICFVNQAVSSVHQKPEV